jgi:hypothetical protein
MQKTVRSSSSDTRSIIALQAALQKQIEKYRAMTGEERLKLALDFRELSCEIARDGIRHQY